MARQTPPLGLVLDIGCGDFRKAFHYLYKTNDRLRFVGLERFSEATIYGESKVSPDIEATAAFRRLACNVETEPFPLEDESIDGIFCSHIIEHVQNKSLLFREMDRVLKRGGYAYIETPGPRSLWMPPHSWLQPIAGAAGYPLNFVEDPTHLGSPLSHEQLEQLVGAMDWKVEAKGYNRELGLAGIPLYILMMAAGVAPIFPKRLRGFLIGAGWWNLVGWPVYVLAKKTDGPRSQLMECG